jgi:hypothetical protein
MKVFAAGSEVHTGQVFFRQTVQRAFFRQTVQRAVRRQGAYTARRGGRHQRVRRHLPPGRQGARSCH